jgi:hypothetical protein
MSRKSAGRRGRPVGTAQKLTPAVQEAICAALKISVPAKYAAEKEGVSERTFYDWLSKGAKGVQPYRDFALAVNRATAEAVCNLTARALAGGPGAAQATWFLEHRFRHEYGPQVLLGGVGGADPIRLKAEHEVAAAICADPAATKMMHEVILLAAANAERPNGKASSDRRRQTRSGESAESTRCATTTLLRTEP